MPIPMPVDREGYCSVEHSSRYWATGYSDWLNVREAVKRYMSPGSISIENAHDGLWMRKRTVSPPRLDIRERQYRFLGL